MAVRELLSAIAVSFGAVGAIYSCMEAREGIPHPVISLVVMGSLGAAACFWATWWHRIWTLKMHDMQEQLNELRMDLIDNRVAGRRGDSPGSHQLKRVK